MIDLLFILHIRRFGFSVIICLESHTIFAASTNNILDVKVGIDEKAAGARLALSLEILRNASSTLSNTRCVEIIEQLLCKDEESMELKTAPSLAQSLGIDPQQKPRRSSIQSNVQQLTATKNDEYRFLNVSGAEHPQIFDQSNFLLTPIPTSAEAQVETPLWCLANKIGTKPRPEL